VNGEVVSETHVSVIPGKLSTDLNIQFFLLTIDTHKNIQVNVLESKACVSSVYWMLVFVPVD